MRLRSIEVAGTNLYTVYTNHLVWYAQLVGSTQLLLEAFDAFDGTFLHLPSVVPPPLHHNRGRLSKCFLVRIRPTRGFGPPKRRPSGGPLGDTGWGRFEATEDGHGRERVLAGRRKRVKMVNEALVTSSLIGPCLTTSSNKLVETSALLVVRGALLVVTRSY